MKQIGVYGFVAITVICAMLLTTGCAQTATIALKFAPEDLTIYRVTTETGKSVQWEGEAIKPEGFQGGHTGNKMEMTFDQDIETVNDEGNAAAKITIKALKYLTKVKDNIVLDFDSSREKDRSNPLSGLVGQSYTIEITPSGQVSRVLETNDALAAVKGGTPANRTAIGLLSTDTIKERHTIPTLPTADKNQLRTGENWSSVKNISFDLMGAKSYERIYTIERIEDSFFAAFMRILSKDPKYHRIAIVQMDAFPSAEKAKELHKQQATGPFSNMFDNTETYTGELKLNLTDGKVEECSEKLLTEWFIVDPNPKNEEEPAALRMAATRLYSIEKID
jgi:hypothetical protein